MPAKVQLGKHNLRTRMFSSARHEVPPANVLFFQPFVQLVLPPGHQPPPLHLHLTLLIRILACVLVACALQPSAWAQLPTRDAGQRQQLPGQDTSGRSAQTVSARPDTILLSRYDARFPVQYAPVPDSLLDLNYVRYDPIKAGRADYVYLNGLAQPAALRPILGTSYQRFRRPTQLEHPAYEEQAPPTFSQNLPFTYTAYDQGGEINDGQVQVLFGRPFDGGWNLGAQYRRIYHGGERNLYPRSRAERIHFGISLARIPDSSRHRSYVWLGLNSATHDDSGGYANSIVSDSTTLPFPDDPFEAVPTYAGLRTEGRTSHYHLLHRVFLREQLDSLPRGFAASVEGTYRQASRVTASLDTAGLGDFVVDDSRGTVRVQAAWLRDGCQG